MPKQPPDASSFHAERCPDSHREHIKAVARTYRSWGFTIFPVNGHKLPTVPWKGYQSRRPTAERFESNFNFIHPNFGAFCGIAAIHGRASKGVACRDFDIADAYFAWVARNREIALTLPTSQTPRGYHVWFRVKTESFHSEHDGEYRADRKHYSVLPPTCRTDDKYPRFTYQWFINEPDSLQSFPIIDPIKHELCSPHQSNQLAQQQPKKWIVNFSNESTSLDTPFSPLMTGIVTHKHDKDDNQCHVSGQLTVQNAITSTQPTRVGERNRCLFNLARRLKAINPHSESYDWRSAVVEWFQLALPTIGTKEFSTSWDDFCRAFEVCRPMAFNDDPITKARRDAEKATGSDAKVLAVARQLASGSVDGIFMLASTLAADLTGLSQKTAHNTLARMVQRGQLELVKASRRMNRGVGHTYRIRSTS